ncbi:MAG: thioredoxin domain-containing protein [Myxococcota bacterium]
MRRHRAMLGGWLVPLVLLACQGAEDELASIKAQQEEILERLSKLEGHLAPARPEEDFSKLYSIPVDRSPVLGSSGAPVTLVAFSDFQCPYCEGSAPLLKAILEKYGDRVRLVYKHFPLSFHPQARPAARAALAAQEQKLFWEMHDVLFESSQRLETADFDTLAARAGLDVERFHRDLESKKTEYDGRINADYAQGLKADVRGTPTLFVNGRKVRTRTMDGISGMIDGELESSRVGGERS